MEEDLNLNQNQELFNSDNNKNLEIRSIEDVMEDNYLTYSMSVIVARALPDVRDGLKPVHRRILFAMNKNGLRSNGKTKKSANVVGAVMGEFHPHGDVAIYDAMVRMAQPWNMRYPLIKGQGNFGSMDGDPPAAMRYTEAKLEKIADELLLDIDKETVDFRDNYDGSLKEPVVLPAKLPNLLLNGQIGIAVGMATNIPPHNLSELAEAIIYQIDHQDATLDEILEFIKGPDFPTGGIIYGKDSIKTAYATGRGGVINRGVAEIQETKNGKKQIVISEIPFSVNKESLIIKIADLVKEKKITGISDIRDESSRGEVKIVVDLKRDGYPNKILNQFFKLTPLQSTFHFNMLALVDGIQPRVLGLQDILKEHIKHRQQVVRRRTEFELKMAKERAHILEGLKIALDNIDEVITTIKSSQNYDEALQKLIDKFKFSEIQSKAILAMRLRRLTGLDRKEIEDELKDLIRLMSELQSILDDEQKILEIIKSETGDLKNNFGDKRKTKIIPGELNKLSDEDLIADEQVVVTLTSANYIKRSSVLEYKKQARGGKGKRSMVTREEDVIENLVNASTHDYLLFFTNKGRVFRLKTYEVPATSLNAKGVALVNLLQLQPEETVSSVININKSSTASNLIMCTVKGVIKKTPFEQYKNVRNSGLNAINLDEGDELKWIRLTNGENEVIISTSMGQAIRFHESNVRPMGRVSRGVRGIRLRPEDSVIGMDIVEENSSIFVISKYGYGKKTKINQFATHARGGVGIRSAVVNAKTGSLVGVKTLGEDSSQEIIIVSKAGQTIRLAINNIPLISRATQGVRIMRLNDDDEVVSLALVDKEIQDETEDNIS